MSPGLAMRLRISVLPTRNRPTIQILQLPWMVPLLHLRQSEAFLFADRASVSA